MALIDEVKAACDRLAPFGWRDLVLQVTSGGLDLAQPSPAALAAVLASQLASIDRAFPGFTDFASQGRHGITPGLPGHSLLYHAFASPAVRRERNAPLRAFPTLAEIEAVENYVFGSQPPTLAQVRQSAGGAKLSVVVFAYEYRSAVDTCSQREADLVFSRTGISRIGTREAIYNSEHRGFQSESPEDPFAFAVCPTRFGAFLATKRKGTSSRFTPMRGQAGDDQLDFWVPVHKLFDGPECLDGLDVRLDWKAFHYNDKIRRVQLAVGNGNPPKSFPFQFSAGIAEFRAGMPAGLLFPVAHTRLVEPARLPDGKFATFRVPPGNRNFAAFEPPNPAVPPAAGAPEVRTTPAYVHARTQVLNGSLVDLGDDPDVNSRVSTGEYDALHYVDFTGEGQIDVVVAGLNNAADVNAGVEPAYSLVSAPDFFPSAGQRELTEWAASAEVPAVFRADANEDSRIWGVPPSALSDVRMPANLQIPGNRFDPAERGVTALVPLNGAAPTGPKAARAEDPLRHSCLPDDAAGVFAPGWDVSTDRTTRSGKLIAHLAAYGLGSPFPEDAKLCAALSTFWPTVAPDITRGMSPSTGNKDLRHTVAPLTDEEIGQSGGLPWDGNRGPAIVTIAGQQFVDFAAFLYVDYVRVALEGRFTSRLTARVTSEEFKRRLLAMAFVYRVLGGNPNRWCVLSFRNVLPGDPELQRAQIDSSTILTGPAYRFAVFRIAPNSDRPSPTDFRRRLLPLGEQTFFLVDPNNRRVLRRTSGQQVWARAALSL